MTSPPRRTRWNEARIARELETWFAERNFDRWPTYRTFVRDGHKRLYTAILESGGADRWAAELGVPHIPHKTGGGLSSDETRAALRQLLRTHRPTRFPTLAWLERHGPAGLAAAVTRTGGGAHWASMLNMPPAALARWTDEHIEVELRRICHNVERWPTRDEFREAGAQGLLRAVYSGHGSRWWAERLGLSTHGLRTRRR